MLSPSHHEGYLYIRAMYVSELGLNLEKRPVDRIIIYVRSGKCMVQSARESHKGAVQ